MCILLYVNCTIHTGPIHVVHVKPYALTYIIQTYSTCCTVYGDEITSYKTVVQCIIIHVHVSLLQLSCLTFVHYYNYIPSTPLTSLSSSCPPGLVHQQRRSFCLSSLPHPLHHPRYAQDVQLPSALAYGGELSPAVKVDTVHKLCLPYIVNINTNIVIRSIVQLKVS